MSGGLVMPHGGVKTTRGVVSRIGSPAIHTAVARHPSRPQRLAAKRPARPLPNGPLWPWLERPASPRARCGVGPSVFSHPRPPASTGRSSTRDPSGKGVERRFEAAEAPLAVHPSVGAAGVPVATRFAGRAFVAQRDRSGYRPLLTLTPTFRFRTRTTGSASTGRCIRTAGDRTIAVRKLLLLRLALLPAQVETYRCTDFAGSVNRVGTSVRARPGALVRSPGVARGRRVRWRRRVADRRGEPDVRTALRRALRHPPRGGLRRHAGALPDGRVRIVPSSPRPAWRRVPWTHGRNQPRTRA